MLISEREIERRCQVIEKYLRLGFAPPSYADVPVVGKTTTVGAVTRAAHELNVDRSSLSTFARQRTVAQEHDPAARAPDWTLYVSSDATVKEEVDDDMSSAVIARLRRSPATLEELAAITGLSRGATLDMLDELRERSHNVQQFGDRWSLERGLAPAYVETQPTTYESRDDDTFVFGVVADSHLGSKYERLDCLNDIYDRFAAAGVDRVYHCGNWIEGEATFNRMDIHKHGLDAQVRYLVDAYPKRAGITTYAVTGDDHEGWYAQRMGIDVGVHAERAMRHAGREDWVNLGYMEAHVSLVNKNTGASATLAVVHPGGGSAYADSYVVQKILESLDGGEKPAVALYGHYHKMLSGEYRNVWWVLVPSTKDQDPFMRKKRLRSVVGGGIVTLRQDPETGAITGMTPELWRYFAKGYYNDRWSHATDVVLPERDTK